jgi:hypothetical protein
MPARQAVAIRPSCRPGAASCADARIAPICRYLPGIWPMRYAVPSTAEPVMMRYAVPWTAEPVMRFFGSALSAARSAKNCFASALFQMTTEPTSVDS